MVQTSEKCFARTIYTTLVVLFSLQLVSTMERQVFDFLGYMWAPIIGNFFQLICVIIGLFGTCQYRPKFIIVYTVWSLLWLGWNIFVICLYLEVGVLSRNKEVSILTIGTKNRSWWLENGVGCRVVNGSWQSEPPVDASRPIPPEEQVQGCLLQYYYVEVIHAAVQCLLSLAGFVVSAVTVYAYAEAEEPQVTTEDKVPITYIDAASSANDELEFVKMRYRSPTHIAAYRDNPSFQDFPPETSAGPGFASLERPPSYDTTMRESVSVSDTTAANHYYASDRRSTRSKASTRSKRSTRPSHHGEGSSRGGGRSGNGGGVQDLPWVQIQPSHSSHYDVSSRQFT